MSKPPIADLAATITRYVEAGLGNDDCVYEWAKELKENLETLDGCE